MTKIDCSVSSFLNPWMQANMRIPLTTDQVRAHPYWNGIYTLQSMCKAKESNMCSWRRYDMDDHMEIFFAVAEVISQRGNRYHLRGEVYHLTHEFDTPNIHVAFIELHMMYDRKTNVLTVEDHGNDNMERLNDWASLFGSFAMVRRS